MPEEKIEKVQERYTDGWMKVPGVIGTGIGIFDGKPCITVFVTAMTDTIERAIPREVDGYRVQFETTGEFRAR